MINTNLKLILYGAPRTKKNSQRIFKCGGFYKIKPSKAFEEYEKDCHMQITGKDKLRLTGAYNLKCVYYMQTKRRVDLVNLLEGTCDILVNANVIEDDNSKIIVSHDGSKVLYDKENPRVEIELSSIS